MVTTCQREWVPTIKTAIERYVAAGRPHEFDCFVDGHCILINSYGRETYRIGLYVSPVSGESDGECDYYGVHRANGESVS